MKKLGILMIVLAAFLYAKPAFASTPSPFFNGFETDINGWIEPERVASGTHEITSATGLWHAEATDDFTRWGGYTNEFPTGGYSTSIDIYLDMTKNPSTGTDLRFDFSSAISNTTGGHRRDFIFNVGTDPAAAGKWIMSASNNAPGWPSNPGRDPFPITETGWYTFRHTFQNNGSGILEVIMDVLDKDGTVLHSWTLSDPTDVIGTEVGGNRYGWFATNAFEFLAIDNSRLTVKVGPPTDKELCKKDGWKAFNNPVFKNQGACVSYVESNYHANKRLQTFTATDSLYYNGLTEAAGLYATGPITFTWNPDSGIVTSGHWDETIGNTVYYNIVTSGTVVNGTVELTFDRTNPNINHFTFTGTLVGGVLTGHMDGPYLFTATGL